MKCPGCGFELGALGRFCHICEEYVEDILVHAATLLRATPHATPAETLIPDDRLEGVIQEAGRKALELLGFKVYSLSQDRATRQTPGIADTYVAGHGRTTWAEWKRPGENQSPDQVDFEIDVVGNGAEYHVWRHESEAIAWAEEVMASRRRVS